MRIPVAEPEVKSRQRFGVPAPPQPRPRFRWLPKRVNPRWFSLLSLLIALGGWQLVANVLVDNPLFFPSLGDVGTAAWKMIESGELWRHMQVSGREFGIGYSLGALAGIVLGALMASNVWLSRLCGPWVAFLYATPTLALAPLFILWLGVGITSKIAVVMLMVVFPVLMNTHQGLSTTDRTCVEVATAYGANRGQLLRKVQLPSAIPFVLVGLRLAVGKGIIGVVVGELFGATAGLGYLVLESANTFNSARLFIGVLVLGLAGITGTALLSLLERKIAPWRFSNAE
jgi:NitT/TauT family transport system permease protein